MKEICTLALGENVTLITSFVDELLLAADCSRRDMVRINIAIDEIYSNIANYAYAGREEPGPVTVQVELQSDPKTALIRFIDSGIPYNPLEAPPPDITRRAEDREIGGLGVFMVVNTMDSVSYEWKDHNNILTITKILA